MASPILAAFAAVLGKGETVARQSLEHCLRIICDFRDSDALADLVNAFAGQSSEINYVSFVHWLFNEEPSAADAAEAAAEALFRRGFSVRQLIHFVKRYRSYGGQSLSTMTTAQVVRDIVIPETRERRCAMVELFEGGPKEPVCLMSHWWGHSFMSLVEAIMGHASGQLLPVENLLSEEELKKTYWLCIFGVNQHVSICGTKQNPCDCGSEKFLNGHPLCEMDKFGVMMKRMQEHALALDRQMWTLTRIWVLKELQTALAMNICTEFAGSLSFAGPFADEKHLPSVRDAEASRPEDRKLILTEIEATLGVDAFDQAIRSKVRQEKTKLAFFDALVRRQVEQVAELLEKDPSLCNVQLRHFGLKSPLHFMCERTRTATEWEDLSGRKEILEKLFRLRADPTLRDSCGRTPLHCISMWDGDVTLAKRLVSCRADVTARAWRGAVSGKTPLELLESEVKISVQHFDRGYQSRSTRKTQELQDYLRSLEVAESSTLAAR